MAWWLELKSQKFSLSQSADYLGFMKDKIFNLIFESTPRGGVNRCMDVLVTNDAEIKTNCNTLSVTKECSRIPGEGLWTISSKFL